MAFSLTFAWQMVNGASHSAFREQVELAMWTIARTKHLEGAESGAERALATRILRGDMWPITVAIKAAATDNTAQDAYVAGGNKLSDAAVIAWLTNAWPTIAGVGGN